MVAAPSTNAPPSLLAGLIGYGIEGSLTPVMHEQEGAAQGMRYVYRRIDLQVLGLAWRLRRSCRPLPSAWAMTASISPSPASRR